ncbi:FHA domain-containing protein [Micropruina sonneratiae]|uniref:FHA domain-containing protein n=1 Tax=Micropruina sonneratiae TaxID=2986940 RepID=UPI002227013A|nr:FHA domain-containing protein [Micropruina sp. KQZ13P-5]MCW3157781.1 FHA domain-containing protein [Micropruina sp. KQZ13P-5]
MIKCPACGHDNADTNNFCANCGTSLAKVTGDTTRVGLPVDATSPEDSLIDDLSAEDQSAISQLPPNSALLIVRQGPAAGARFLVNSDVTTAGRHPRCDIFLDDITVSRNHARLTRRDGHIWVEDENSLNGTYVNKALIDGPVALRRGDEVQIGKFRMLFFNHPG